MLLALALILNSSIGLLCLYAPKIYAIFYVAEEKMHVRITGTSVAPATGSSDSQNESKRKKYVKTDDAVDDGEYI